MPARLAVDGVDVGQVHFQRVVGFFSEAKGWGGRDRGQNGVDLREGGEEIASEEGADLLRLAVVGVVVALRSST